MPASATFSEGENFLLKMQLVGCSVTRLGDLLHFGQLFKARGNNNLTQIAHILGNFCKGIEIFNFSCEIIFGQLLYTFGDYLLVTLAALGCAVTCHLRRRTNIVRLMECSWKFKVIWSSISKRGKMEEVWMLNESELVCKIQLST